MHGKTSPLTKRDAPLHRGGLSGGERGLVRARAGLGIGIVEGEAARAQQSQDLPLQVRGELQHLEGGSAGLMENGRAAGAAWVKTPSRTRP